MWCTLSRSFLPSIVGSFSFVAVCVWFALQPVLLMIRCVIFTFAALAIYIYVICVGVTHTHTHTPTLHTDNDARAQHTKTLITPTIRPQLNKSNDVISFVLSSRYFGSRARNNTHTDSTGYVGIAQWQPQ